MHPGGALFLFRGDRRLIFETVEKTTAMKTKSVFSRYRRALYIVLAVLVCVDLWLGFRYYKKAGRDNHIEVYDLTWPDKTDKDNIVYRRWRYFIESKTNLPRKIEKYSKADPNDNYTLEETLVIGYPTDEQIRAAIKDADF